MKNCSFYSGNATVHLLMVFFFTLSLVSTNICVQAAKKRQKGPQPLAVQQSVSQHSQSTTEPTTLPSTSKSLPPLSTRPPQTSNPKISKCDASFAVDLLQLHNRIRVAHSAPPLQLNSNITKLAQLWSEELARTGFLKHRPNSQSKMGENLYTARLLLPRSLRPSEPMALWYRERHLYRWYGGEEPDLKSFTNWGHYTALVWRSSRLVGIGCAVDNGRVRGNYSSPTNTVYVTVNYYPKGNVVGYFANNVRPAKENIWAYEGAGGTIYPSKSTTTKKFTTKKPTTQRTTTKRTTAYSTRPPKRTTTTTTKAPSTSTTTTETSTTEMTTNLYTTDKTFPTTLATVTTSNNSSQKPNSRPTPSCNNSHSYNNLGYPYQVVRPLQPPPPPPPVPVASYPAIDFTDPDDFEDFLKLNDRKSLAEESSPTKKHSKSAKA